MAFWEDNKDNQALNMQVTELHLHITEGKVWGELKQTVLCSIHPTTNLLSAANS